MLPIADTQEYQASVDGHVTVSSEKLDIEGVYVSWHTQRQKASECVRPPTAEHQFVLYCSDEEKGEYRYNDRQWQSYIKRRNEWFIAPAFENQIMWRWRQAESPGLVCRFHLSPTLLEQAASLHHDRAVYCVRLKHRMNIEDALLTDVAFELRDELQKTSDQTCSARYSRSLINTFTHRLIKAYAESSGIDSLPAGSHLTDDRKARLEAFIDRHLDQSLTIDDLCSQVWLSKYHFCRLFKSTYAETPRNFVQRRRIAKACRLLRETECSVTEIALMTGLSINGGFSRCFKSHTGLTPSEYRRAPL
ncbi:AraC family transcriptional regulator [Salinisphaera sp.]|uniref:AraC family transcriptional regulator n=1 Tax=Salinisphaera sp. TaxID=1914330 RepID=UPI002D766003|nr:AraC family transcriptional regulator [Salinisphaera sp.]HET7314633.1 AraC family transcriptional regulator [Salinisphaera sp.]